MRWCENASALGPSLGIAPLARIGRTNGCDTIDAPGGSTFFEELEAGR